MSKLRDNPMLIFYLGLLLILTHFSICNGSSVLDLNALKGSETDVKVGDCITELEMDSETNRRVLAMQKKYISYETLKKDLVPCARPGASYYNCHAVAANPYNRGCEVITRCRVASSVEIKVESWMMANQNLNGRVAIVTGGSRGIGREIVLHLHSLGARVVINYASSSNQADELASQLNTKTSPQVSAIAAKADVSDPDLVKLLFDKVEQEMGAQVHILVNCAGVLDPKYPSLADTTVDDWDNTFNINTKGAFLVCREATNRLARGAGGRIIMITTSVVGGLMPGYAAYAASKAAVETMTKIVAKELKGSGITANCVAPGPVATELFFAGKSEETVNRITEACPLGRLGQPHDVSQVVGFLAGDAGEWINGQVLRVNGGALII
ncbi:hypothetical protein ACLB2K_035172 [Fragaria x ananassa]